MKNNLDLEWDKKEQTFLEKKKKHKKNQIYDLEVYLQFLEEVTSVDKPVKKDKMVDKPFTL